jgi:hypothetical protein
MLNKPGPPPKPSDQAILSEPRGAIARRNRVLKVYGLVLVAGILGLVGYCAMRPGFDLSTPEKALKTFQRAMDDQRWSVAEKCLTPECHKHYEASIADRSLFDFYNPNGYTVESYNFPRDWRVRSVEKNDKDEKKATTAQAWICSGLPFAGADQAGFNLYLVRCPDGLWRVDGPREDVVKRYEQYIPERARGWAAAEERR